MNISRYIALSLRLLSHGLRDLRSFLPLSSVASVVIVSELFGCRAESVMKAVLVVRERHC